MLSMRNFGIQNWSSAVELDLKNNAGEKEISFWRMLFLFQPMPPEARLTARAACIRKTWFQAVSRTLAEHEVYEARWCNGVPPKLYKYLSCNQVKFPYYDMCAKCLLCSGYLNNNEMKLVLKPKSSEHLAWWNPSECRNLFEAGCRAAYFGTWFGT